MIKSLVLYETFSSDTHKFIDLFVNLEEIYIFGLEI